MITVVNSIAAPEGDGVIVKRLMPVAGLRNFDPFVLWDHFDINSGGFPDHPHRGFEAITYLFEGGMNHADNLGNRGAVHAGGAQRFTAGRGIVHSEFPDGHAAGIQLWINLPKRLKGIEADYQQLQADMIPESRQDGIIVRTIAGDAGAVTLHSEAEYLDIRMNAATAMQRCPATGHRGFVYVVEGSVSLNGESVKGGQAALIDGVAALEISSDNGARLMWCFGKAHGEPIFQHGPYVD
jgi:redox-sensitive bicupin YhaK (pirin superfamily)